MRISLFTATAFFVILLIFGATSCKDPDLPKALVTVVTVSGVAVEGAEVTVYSDPHHTNEQGNVGYVDPQDTVLIYEAITNAEGQASFEFKYEAIYDVKATYVQESTNDTLKGTGVLILENDKTYEEKVIIR